MAGRVRNGRTPTRADVIEAVEALKGEILARLDGSDRLTEEKFRGVRASLAEIQRELAEAKASAVAVRQDAEKAIESARREMGEAISDVEGDIEASTRKVSAVELTIARMLGWAAGAGAIAGLIVALAVGLLKVIAR